MKITPTYSASLPSSIVKMRQETVQSSLAKKIAVAPSAQAAANVQAGAPSLTAWTPALPTKESTATTGMVTGDTASGAMKLNLKKGGVYSFGAGYSNKYSGAKPTLYMTVTNSAGKVVTSSKTNTLSWTATATDDYVITFGITPAKGGTAVFTKYNIDASQSLSKLPASSGDKNVDAVLAGGAAWWHDAGNVASVSTTPISSTIKQLTGASQTVYYGFLTGNESFLAAKDQVGFKAMDDQQQTVVQSAFDYLSSLINVSFVHDETKATIEFGTNNQTSSAGYASYPQGNGANPSVLLLDNSDNPGNSGSALGVKGQYGWETLIHEIGHAMGLKHPGAYNAGGGTTAGPYLSAALDNRANSIMSYNDPLASKVLSLSASGASSYTYSTPAANPYTYQTLDIAALQYLYGANKATVASDVTLTDSYKNFQTIWAPQAGGVGLNAASTTRTNLFDLREGGYSSVSMRLTDGDFTSELKDGFLGIGYSATNAAAAANRLYTSLKTTKNSSKQLLSTTLYNGKNNVALSYGSKYSTVTGGKSSDKFYASNYSATLDGGDGTDTVYLQGSAKDWVIDANKTTATSKVGSVTIGLRNIESIAFYKSTEALIHA